MDVLGAAASIVQLVTVAGQVISEVRRYSKSVKNYPRTAEQLLQQLETMQRVLRDLSTVITPAQLQIQTVGAPQRAPDTSNLQFLIGDSVKRCEQSLQEIYDKVQATKVDKLAPTNRLKRWTSGFSKRLLWPFTEEETKELIASLGTHERQFLIAMNAATFRKVNVVEEHAKAEKLRLLRKWISNTEYSSKYSRSLAVRNRKTGSWLLKDPRFKSWTRKGNSQIFWLNGIPGCGKTMLTSMVIEHAMPVNPDCVGAYFYCDGTDATSINVGNILRSLLAQLLFYNPSRTEPLLTRLQDMRLTGANLPSHPSQLQDYIVEAASYYTEATIVLDAVDECHKNAREELLPFLVYLVEQVSSLRLFISSRDELDIRENLIPLVSTIDFSLGDTLAASSLHEDIRVYIQDEFDRKPRLKRLSSGLKMQISDTMLESDNMFRWVQCQVDNIVKCRSEEDIHEVLTNLPAGLNETYEVVLDKITHKTDIALAKHTFRWLIGAKRPLRLPEIVAALNIAENEGPRTLLEEEELLDICGSLITFDPSTQVLRFSHITVQEFLLSGHLAKSDRSHFSFGIPDVEHKLTIASLRYLLSQDLNIDETGASYGKHPDRDWFTLDQNVLRKQYKARPLLLYAARYWNRHLRLAYPATDDIIYSLVTQLFKTPEKFGNYCSVLQARFVKDDLQTFCDPTSPEPPMTHIRRKSLMYYLIQSGANWLPQRLLAENPSWVEELHFGYGHGTPLMLAIKHGNIEMLQFLLDAGANPNKMSAPSIGIPQWHPLHYTVMCQNSAALELLILRGANVNLRYGPEGGKTALHYAAASGIATMVEKLLDSGAYPSALDNTADSPLRIAVDRNFLNIVQLLVQGGAETDTWGTKQSPLWHALALRSGPIVEYLFSNLQCGPISGRVLREIDKADFSWAQGETWHSKLVPSVMKHRDHLLATAEKPKFSPSETDVYNILWMLRELLGNEPSKRIAARILDMAEVWIPITASRYEASIVSETLDQLQPYKTRTYSTRTDLIQESRANLHPYLTLTLPAGLPERVIRNITFRTKSHDQGKVGQRPPDGYLWSRTGTGTWLEATIVGDVHPREYVHVIHQNLPGVPVGRVHTNAWDLSERTCTRVQNWLTRPRGGIKIGVYARAYFEGWVNQVESVEMEVRYATGGAHVQSPLPSWQLGPPLSQLGL